MTETIWRLAFGGLLTLLALLIYLPAQASAVDAEPTTLIAVHAYCMDEGDNLVAMRAALKSDKGIYWDLIVDRDRACYDTRILMSVKKTFTFEVTGEIGRPFIAFDESCLVITGFKGGGGKKGFTWAAADNRCGEGA